MTPISHESADRAVSVLQVVTDDDRRGAQVFASDLDRALTDRGVLVRTVALASGTSGGLGVPTLGARRLGYSTLQRLRAEAQNVDVVAAHGSSTLPASAIATIGTGTPFVYRQISDSRFWAPSFSRRIRVGVALSRAARVVALYPQSATTLHEHLGVPTSRTVVIPNGVDTTKFVPPSVEAARARRLEFGLAPDRRTALVIGALAPEKGVDMAIRATASQGGELQLLVVGDGPASNDLRRLALALAPEQLVAFTGSLPDPRPAYEAADFVILASRGGDSMPAVLIEAALIELPAVTTPVEGIPEIVIGGQTGDLVPVGDQPTLDEAVQRFTADEALTRRMGSAARQHCLERFDIKTIAGAWERVLRDAASATPQV